ncbi:MAG: Eco29kI family restriction endonuclease [Methanomicrobiales archaeon]|nr:Eco29kI family restriction endonuclease [Methanomicrobiales archaeon]
MSEIILEKHQYKSPTFKGIVEDAISFLEKTPSLELPPDTQFEGSGVYALYYFGNFQLYQDNIKKDSEELIPIYVGKAVPSGWRTARNSSSTQSSLSRRLREHARSIESTTNLNVDDFSCKFIILDGLEGDLIVPIEATLIRFYMPLWNSVIDGFGNHDPGSGRYNQSKSEWDVLHPGRGWAERLTGVPPSYERIIDKIKRINL